MTKFVLVTCPKCGHVAEVMYVENATWRCLKCKNRVMIDKSLGQKRITDFIC